MSADEVGQQLHVVGPRAPAREALAELDQAPRADATGDALAARLVAHEALQQRRQLDDAGPLVDDEDAARPDDRARLVERRSPVGRVDGAGRQEATGRPADEDGLELAGGAAGGLDDGLQGAFPWAPRRRPAR